MSYDYWLMRARAPIRTSNDVDEPNVRPIGTYEEIKELFVRAFPKFQWDDAEEYGWVKDESEDILLMCGVGETGPQFLHITVKAWWRENFKENLVKLAEGVGLFAFDPQKVELIGGCVDPRG